jgi:RNA polymerase sigma-70 factor, ECF subfamily
MEMAMVSLPDGGMANALCVTGGSAGFDEEHLVAEARGGSLAAFEQLVECHESKIFRVARRIARSYEDAEDIMQEAFVQAYKNLSNFRGESRFYTWLVRITINAGLMSMRRRHLNEVSIDVPAKEGLSFSEIQDWGPNPEQRYSQEELHGILEAAIAQLTPGYRIVFQLREVEGFSTEETAQALSLSLTAVKSRLRRARVQLRESLNRYFKPNNGQRRLQPGNMLVGTCRASSRLNHVAA